MGALRRGGVVVTKADIVRQIAQVTGLTKTDAAAVVDGFIESVVDALEKGEHIEIRGFGTFKAVSRAPRTGRNPRTGSEVKISRRRAPVFKPSKELRARVEDNGNPVGGKKNAVWKEEKAA
ncbi:uncharacterized protein METZ01_LOCUS295005 [marine metagenome]|uniref:Integration host factor subunit beta n=1 Tax=marine metagenome TaxID=408172 RepID=A0A382M4K5_9ZZZZ